MKSKTLIRLIAAAAIPVILACGFGAPAAPSQSDVATVVASTVQAHTAVPNFNNVTYGNVSLTIPRGLATNALTGTVPALTDSQQLGPWAIAPEHIEILLDNYSQVTFYQRPQILVYPAEDFSSMSDQVKENIRRVQGIVNKTIPLAAENMPGIPFFNAGQVIAAQMQTISFKNGAGVRLVTQYGNGIAPVSNSGLFYHFQGLTSDGKYYIIATLPTQLPFLPIDNNPSSPIPSGGIPFPQNNASGPDFENYYSQITNLINAAQPDQFSPTLTSLDALIQSISTQ